jgi:hypothetical protein
MHKSLHPLSLFLLILLSQACVQKESEQSSFSLCITDALKPKGLLPESLELNSQGKLIMLTNRFNADETLYQKNFFIELSHQQMDSVYKMLQELSPQALSQMETLENDSVIYKIALSQVVNKQRQSFHLVGSQFTPALMKLIAYSYKLPEYKHHFKLKESHYFSTVELCTGSQTHHAEN